MAETLSSHPFRRLICLDFDGTMINSTAPVPLDPGLMRILEELRKDGAAWVINTGRRFEWLMDGLTTYQFGLSPDFIICEESLLFRPGSQGGWSDDFAWNMTRRDYYNDVQARGESFFAEVQAWIAAHTEAEYLHMPGAPDEIISSTEGEMDEIAAFLRKVCQRDGLDFIAWERNHIYLRFGHPAFSKGTALGELMGLLNMDPSHVFVAGDNRNDVSMLSLNYAEALACPDNSLDLVKDLVREQGGYVARGQAGEGVAEALTHYYAV